MSVYIKSLESRTWERLGTNWSHVLHGMYLEKQHATLVRPEFLGGMRNGVPVYYPRLPNTMNPFTGGFKKRDPVCC